VRSNQEAQSSAWVNEDVDSQDFSRSRWAMILAGGDGRRLSSYTRQLTRKAVPKQFCRLIGRKNLLQQTIERLSLIVNIEHTLVALTRTHEEYYAPIVEGLSPRQLVIQPVNRDTAPAILYCLLRLSVRSPQALVALIPSDHYVSDDALFMKHVDHAFREVQRQSDLIILLGIPPTAAETSYGWIEPGPSPLSAAPVYPVRAFYEKPSPPIARELYARRCLWNSFVVVARVQTLLDVFEHKLPHLTHAFVQILPALETKHEARTVENLYRHLLSTNFSRRILANTGLNLGVLPVFGLRWSDLGDARRVMETLCQLQMMKRNCGDE
jgi:mannose-1-phosphate guanylyltransferase